MFIWFFLLWLLLAGEVSLHACLWGVVVSGTMHWFCRKYLGYSGHRGVGALKKVGAGAAYIWYLLVEMLKAGFVVMKLIYTRGREMRPQLVWFDTTLQGDGARAVLANSITLTAGTITVTAEDGRLCVHALDASLAAGLEDSEFQRRLETLER